MSFSFLLLFFFFFFFFFLLSKNVKETRNNRLLCVDTQDYFIRLTILAMSRNEK